MSFTSPTFFLFLALVLGIFSIVPRRFRWLLLLVSSYSFYALVGAPHLLVVLATVTATSFICGILIDRSGAQWNKFWLFTGIALELSMLIWLKYLPFLSENLNAVLAVLSPGLRFASSNQFVAIGASYFIFQGISYMVDVYLGVLGPELHPGRFALFMAFFPKIMQGPIERGENLLPQLGTLSRGTKEHLRAGINLFLWGIFKKVLIADRLAAFVDPVFNDVHNYHGLSLVIAIYLFALQIYFDFSGYTDMARGIARLFNISLTQNFDSPYFATSITDFWRRWHISFSSWLLDYVFKPLQFSFRSGLRWGTPLALMLTFLVSGIWHGASWCFVVWGFIHGVYLTAANELKVRKLNIWKGLHLDKSRLLRPLQILMTFHLVCFSWIFFRATTISDALYVAWSIIAETPDTLESLFAGSTLVSQISLGTTALEVVTIAVCLAIVAAIGVIERKASADSDSGGLSWLGKLPIPLQGFCYGVFCYIALLTSAGSQSFIYLQF